MAGCDNKHNIIETKLRAAAALILFLGPLYAAAQIQLPDKTNIQFFLAAADSAHAELVRKLDIDQNSAVMVKCASNEEPLAGLLVQRFERALHGRGIRVVYGDSSYSGIYIDIIYYDIGIVYDKVSYTGLFRKKMIRRNTGFSYSVHARDLHNNRPLFSEDAEISTADWVNAADLHYLEKNSCGLVPDRKPVQALPGWAEFSLAFLFLTALTYLLYSVRGQ